MLRNVGVPIGHSYLAFTYLIDGLNKLSINKAKLDADLEANFIVVSEAIQTILRREGFDNPYELLKEHTRGKEVSADTIHQIIENLPVSEAVKQELNNVTPFTFIGVLPSNSNYFNQSLQPVHTDCSAESFY